MTAGTGTGSGRFSPIPRQARPWQGRPAGIVTRLAAAVVDTLVVAVAVVAGYLLLAGLLLMLDPRGYQLPRAGPATSLIWGLLVAFGYLAGGWAISGRTYGALVLGLRVQRQDGRPLGRAGSITRAAACVLVPVGLLWVLLSRRNCSLQDLVLRTRVVYDWQPRENGATSASPPGG